MLEIDPRDRDLLHALQTDVPLVFTPFAVIGQIIEMSEKEVIKRVDRLRTSGVLRQISATFDGRALGYRFSLVAARVAPEELDAAAAVINSHPGVFQNYARNHEFNLWFTIAVSPSSRLGLEATVDLLAAEAGCSSALLLPTMRTFKAGTENEAALDAHHESDAPVAPALSAREIEVIRLLQTDLPNHPRPFDTLARLIPCEGEEFLEIARGLVQRGLLRGIHAAAQSRRASFTANAMGVWAVPADQIESFSRQAVALSTVSHCFLRPKREGWPYNIFTTVHGKSIEECESTLQTLVEQTGIGEMRVLFPTREYKRSHVDYFSPLAAEWEDTHAPRADSSAALS